MSAVAKRALVPWLLPFPFPPSISSAPSLGTTIEHPRKTHGMNYIVERYHYSSMPSILIRLDEPLLRALNKAAPSAKRQRAEFVRQAIRDAIRKREYEAIREACLRQPDSPVYADDWSNAEEWQSRSNTKSGGRTCPGPLAAVRSCC